MGGKMPVEWRRAYNRAWRVKNRERLTSVDGKRRVWESQTRIKYGLSPEDVARRLEQQGLCCAICLSSLMVGLGAYVDHCHRTGKFRGLLCRRCNLGIGHFEDRPSTLRRAADYLTGDSK